MNKFKRKHVFSVIFTLFVVFLLVFSGPASAVTINVATDKETYDASDSSITFTVQVDIESNERIPVQNLTLRITGPNSFSKNCTFTPTGTNLTSCSNLEITVINSTAISSSYGNGSMFGSGYGYNFTSGQWGIENQTFGENYGYGYISGHEYNSSSYAELAYNITWNISAESTPLTGGTYYANLEALTQSSSYARTYSAQTSRDFGYVKPPTYSLNSTNTTMAGKPTEFRLKWNDDVGLSGYIFSLSNCSDSFANSSWTPMTGATNWSNVTHIINSTVGCTIRWIVYANNTNNKWNTSQIYSFTTTDGDPPTWSNPQNSTPTIYSSSALSEFNITWQDNVAVSKIFIEINLTGTASNYSMTNTYGGSIYNYSIVLPAGTFTWKSYANDTSNNWNSSSSWSFTIGKTAPAIHLALNQSEGNTTCTYPEAINVTGWVEVPSGETGNLYKNNTLISGFTDSDSFASFNSSRWLNDTTQVDFIGEYSSSSSAAWKINDSNLVGYNLGSLVGGQNFWYKTKLNLPLNVSWYAKVPSLVNWEIFAVCLVDTNDTAYRTAKNQTCLAYADDPPDKWGVVTMRGGSGSWSYSNTTELTFSTFKKHELRWNGTWLEAYRDDTLVWNGTLSDFPNTGMYLVFIISHNSAHGIDTYFYIDNITIRTAGETREIRTLTPTHYNYTFVYNGNENYSSSSATYYAFVNKAPTSVNLYINGSASNQTSSYPNSTLNVTAVSNVSGLYVQLWRNGTLIANSTTAVTNITKWGAWNNNFTIQVLGNENYLSSDSVTLWWNVSKGGTLTTLYLNGSTANQTSAYPNSTINATATSNVSNLYVQLWRNNTLIHNITGISWNVSDQGAYNNNFTAQVQGNENYSNGNVIMLWWNISKGDAPLVLSNNISWSGTYSAPSNTTGSGCPSGISCNLSRNNNLVTSPDLVLLGAGTHNYIYNTSGNENYSSNSTSNTLTINQKNASVKVYPITQTITYPQSVIEYCTVNSSLINCNIFRNGSQIVNGTNETLGAGVYSYLANISDTSNYTNTQDSSTLTIDRATSSCSLSGITNHTYGLADIVVCSCTGEGTANLYQNNTLRDEWNNTARMYENATYIWVCNMTDINYTDASTSKTQTINVTNTTTGTYTNNSVSTTANTTTTINATTTSGTIITLDAVTTSNVTNSFISITEYNSTPSGITNLTTIGIYGLNKFFDISVGSSLNSSLRWAVVNISYNESEVNASNLDESSLRIYYYNSTLSNWTSYDTPFGGVNTTSNYVWANTTHFSYYSLGGLLANGQSCNSNSNCSSGYCVHSICRSSSPYCGDGYCDSGETITNCPIDCPSSTPYVGSGWVTPTIKKEENVTQEAEEKPICQEVWTCTDWSDCQNSVETRICNDANNCGTTDKKPILSQSCVVPTSAPSISPPTSTTSLGLGVGLIAVIALSAIIIFIILKRKKIKKKTKFANMIP